MRGEKRQELGRPCWFQLEGKHWHGIRIMSHAWGKPSTPGRPDPKPEWTCKRVGPGRQKRSQADDPQGVGSPQSTRRAGEPSTRGRGGRWDGVLTGNLDRTCWAGVTKPTSLRSIAISQTTGSAAASPTEEPGAGKPHAGICAGGVG